MGVKCLSCARSCCAIYGGRYFPPAADQLAALHTWAAEWWDRDVSASHERRHMLKGFVYRIASVRPLDGQGPSL